MFITLYILSLLVGGIIGYVTNDITIRMLFRPHTAIQHYNFLVQRQVVKS